MHQVSFFVTRGCSSNGRASALHAEGTGIDTLLLHFFFFFLKLFLAELLRPWNYRRGFEPRTMQFSIILTPWRNGNASDSRPEDWGFDSLWGHKFLCRYCKKRQRRDLNSRGQSPVDFESTSLTTRTRCRILHV